MQIKNFMTGAARIATALFLAGLALGAVGGLIAWGIHAYQEHKVRPYESMKTWQVEIPSSLELQIDARTKLVSHQLHVALDLKGYPAYLSDPRMAEINKNGNFTVHFVDTDGFKVFTKEIPISEFTRIVGDNGQPVGLQAQAQSYIDPDDYARFARLDVQWRLQTSLPQTVSAPRNPPALLDHCAPHLTRAERLKRLAAFGDVRESGAGSYTAGEKTLTFFDDGSLLDCR